jgi:hypothetical protein
MSFATLTIMLLHFAQDDGDLRSVKEPRADALRAHVHT